MAFQIDENLYYDLKDITEVTGISLASLKRYLKSGELLGKKQGGRGKWIVSGENLKRFLEPESVESAK